MLFNIYLFVAAVIFTYIIFKDQKAMIRSDLNTYRASARYGTAGGLPPAAGDFKIRWKEIASNYHTDRAARMLWFVAPVALSWPLITVTFAIKEGTRFYFSCFEREAALEKALEKADAAN